MRVPRAGEQLLLLLLLLLLLHTHTYSGPNNTMVMKSVVWATSGVLLCKGEGFIVRKARAGARTETECAGWETQSMEGGRKQDEEEGEDLAYDDDVVVVVVQAQ